MRSISNIIEQVWKYARAIIVGVWNLVLGMYITMRNFLRRKVTEQYPENRGKKVYFERSRGQLKLEADKCIACGLCQLQCPNGTLALTVRSEEGKKRLDSYRWDYGRCTFCSLCVQVCPTKAIMWSPEFEGAVFSKTKLLEELTDSSQQL